MDTLMLDQSYAPIAVVSWQRAVTLLFEQKVEVVESHERVLNGVSFSIKMPSIVRFVRAVRKRKSAVKFSRESIWARDQGRCQYCGGRVSRDEFSYDHVTPRAQGGQTTFTNIVVACFDCNQRKGGRTPAQAGMALRTQPVRPTKLPDSMRFTVTYRAGMPVSWRQWLRDLTYWSGALDET